MACLVVEIGNTALKAAFTDGRTIGKTFRYQGENSIDYIVSLSEKERPEVIALACVSPISSTDVGKISECCDRLLVLDGSDDFFQREYCIPSYISPDRASSIVAAREMFRDRSCTIFDLGTMMSIDFIGPDGAYLGGNISPGCRTRFKSVNRYSKSLPLLETPGNYPEKGMSVESSIASGVISGIVFEIESYISLNPGNANVFTGGDAVYFAKRTKNPIFVVCNLVLMGLAIISEKYVTKKS